MRYIRVIEVEQGNPLPCKWHMMTLTEFVVFQANLIDDLIDGKHYEMRQATEAEALEWSNRARDWKTL